MDGLSYAKMLTASAGEVPLRTSLSHSLSLTKLTSHCGEQVTIPWKDSVLIEYLLRAVHYYAAYTLHVVNSFSCIGVSYL